MILLAHMLFGAAIGSAVKNPLLAVVLALLGHYFLDFFPHIEYLKSTAESLRRIKSGNWQKSVSDILKVFLDFMLGLLIIFSVSNNKLMVYICVVAALLPDTLTVITHLWPNNLLLKHHWFHEKIHYFKYKKARALNLLSARPSTKNIIFSALVSIPFRIITQLIVVIISIILLQL